MNRMGFAAHRLAYLSLCLVLGVSVLVISSRRAESGAADALVRLQPATPGTQQVGHLNISGAAKVGSFTMAAGSGAGKVLTSDASGNGAWQAATGLTLPYSGTNNSSGTSFLVSNTGSGVAINGQGPIAVQGNSSSGSGVAIYGLAQASIGPSYGVLGVNSSVSGFGAAGVCTATSGSTQAGHFQAVSTEGTGVFAYASSTTGVNYGLFAQTDSTQGTAIKGVATAGPGLVINNQGNGTTYAADVTSSGGFGLRVTANGWTAINAYGFYGIAGTGALNGIVGYETAPAGTASGVYGEGTGGSYGVLGKSTGPFAVFAQGNSGATGTKSFRIDHPLDPENKYLLHYSVEGPVPQNVYNGMVTTDARGEAWVQLPDYFEAINKDFLYTLTVVDDTDSDQFVLAKIARTMTNGRFKIRTSVPHVQVSWEVKATRNDLWVRKHGAPIEVEKGPDERGKYQQPELYGYGEARAIPTRPGSAEPQRAPSKSNRATPLPPQGR